MKLWNRLFPKATELAEAQKCLVELRGQLNDALMKNVNLRQSNEELRFGLTRVETERNGLLADLGKAKAKLREQTDADLMLVSARIIADVMKGKKPEQHDLALQQNLWAQRNAMQNNMGMASNLGMAGASIPG